MSHEINRRGSAEIVDDYDRFCEGDFEPHLGKTIRSLVFKTKTFIVYLDEELYVEWAFTDAFKLKQEAGPVLNRVSEIQALPVSHLDSKELISSFRTLIGEAVARVLSEGDVVAAQDALDKALAWLQARNAEISRWWYLESSSVTVLIIVAVTALLWLLRDFVTPLIGKTAFEVALGAGFGGLGAFFSILVGSKSVPQGLGTAKGIYMFQGVAKVLGGTLGAVLVALAIKAQLILGFMEGKGYSLESLVLLCMVAGLSERLVPNLVEQVEGKVMPGGSPRT